MKTLPHAKQLRAKKCFDRSGVRGKKIPSEVFLDIKILRRELRACVCVCARVSPYCVMERQSSTKSSPDITHSHLLSLSVCVYAGLCV